MWAFVSAASCLAVFSALLCGCGSEPDGDRRLAKIRDELARVQADRDRVDQRLLALETRSVDSRPEAPKPPPETPALRVVRLGPERNGSPPGAGSGGATHAEETASAVSTVDDTTPRPMLRVVGDGRAKRRGALTDRIEQTWPSEEPAASAPGATPSIREQAPRPSALDPAARRAYDDALALVNGGKCQPALDAFAGFLVRWPDHPNADNAMYWRGECYGKLGDLPRAIEQYEGTIARFPMGNKVPDALLKLGMAYAKLGNAAKADEAWQRLEREFPLSEARRRIPNRPESKS